MEKILIYTDGSSLGNPGPGGWGAIVATEIEVREIGGFDAKTTNNRMELTAAYEALALASSLPDKPIVIRTDSTYVLQGATTWGAGWKRREWKTIQGGEVLNRDLWEPLLELLEELDGRVTWEKVGGHVNVPGNERVDTIATSFAAGKTVELYVGAREGYRVDLEKVEHDEEAHAKRSESRARSKAKAYSYVSLVGGEIQVHKDWEACKARVEGAKGARYKKALSEADEAAIIQEFTPSTLG